MSVAIVGAGAVGRLLALACQESGVPFQILGRKGPLSLQQTVLWRGRSYILECEPNQLRETPRLWLFATKAYDLAAALQLWNPSKDSVRVALCNGYLAPQLPPEVARGLRKGLVTRGARFDEAGTLIVNESGQVLWGTAGEPEPYEAEVLRALAPHGFVWDASACAARREKWYFNTVLNTMAGAFRLPRNGDAPLRPEWSALKKESYALGCRLWPDWALSEAEAYAKLDALVHAVADNENSMARDVRLQRLTEADYLSGYAESYAQNESEFALLRSLHRVIVQNSPHSP